MILKYKKECLILLSIFVVCFGIFAFIKVNFFHNYKINTPIRELSNNASKADGNTFATTLPVATTEVFVTARPNMDYEIEDNEDTSVVSTVDSIPYSIAPTYHDDGSIIYDGMTLTELTDKLDRYLKGYLTNTGYFFADYTKKTGLNPYLAVAIVLLETGCNWTCSSLTTQCNNIGGLKGSGSCNGGSYSKYDTLGEGIENYLSIIYNNYYLKGLTTPEQMASTYAASSSWSEKVNTYINQIKNS
ncbi:MAG TPA: glucosaminidase domain-containing protein [Bacilli bacterium]|nr:glucosaminidase domain-containing protein [Bacilli bacterium]